MKYVATFIHENGSPTSNYSLTFGQDSVQELARTCFEMGEKKCYTGVKIKRIGKSDADRIEKILAALDFAIKITDVNDEYSNGVRKGLLYSKFLIDDNDQTLEALSKE